MFGRSAFVAASATIALLRGVGATSANGNEEPRQPACTTPFQPFVYAGCFRDTGGPRALLYDSKLPANNMTAAICIDFCKGNNYRYAGVENYGGCYCGASVIGKQVPENDCSIRCTGTNQEICAEERGLSVYQDPTFLPVNTSIVSDFHYMGCYSEGNSGQVLAWKQDQLDPSSLTTEKCLLACKAGGYGYGGVEHGSECYCGVVLGNGSVPINPSSCDIGCIASPGQACGGLRALDLYVAKDMGSSQPCNRSLSTTSMSKTSSTASHHTMSTPFHHTCISSNISFHIASTSHYTEPSSTPQPTESSSTSQSTAKSWPNHLPKRVFPTFQRSTTSATTATPLCTETVIPSPGPICEYECGKWCSAPLPSFNNKDECSTAASFCSIQESSCFIHAGYPGSIDCFKYSKWCKAVSTFCDDHCLGESCSLDEFKSQSPPLNSGPSPLKARGPVPPLKGGPPFHTVRTSLYRFRDGAPTHAIKASVHPLNGGPPLHRVRTSVQACTATTLAKATPVISSVIVPTCANICVQPNSPSKGYTTSSPVGDIPLPCLTCNNIESDFSEGHPYKLYTNSSSIDCPSYSRSGVSGPVAGCKDACNTQYQSCLADYAMGAKEGKWEGDVTDTYQQATDKCHDQWVDCLMENKNVPATGRCIEFNSGWGN